MRKNLGAGLGTPQSGIAASTAYIMKLRYVIQVLTLANETGRCVIQVLTLANETTLCHTSVDTSQWNHAMSYKWQLRLLYMLISRTLMSLLQVCCVWSQIRLCCMPGPANPALWVGEDVSGCEWVWVGVSVWGRNYRKMSKVSIDVKNVFFFDFRQSENEQNGIRPNGLTPKVWVGEGVSRWRCEWMVWVGKGVSRWRCEWVKVWVGEGVSW